MIRMKHLKYHLTKYYIIKDLQKKQKENKLFCSHVKTMMNEIFMKGKIMVSLYYNDMRTGTQFFCATSLVLNRASTHRQCVQRRTTGGLTLHLWDWVALAPWTCQMQDLDLEWESGTGLSVNLKELHKSWNPKKELLKKANSNMKVYTKH